jgi:hypothetical protein
MLTAPDSLMVMLAMTMLLKFLTMIAMGGKAEHGK